MQNYYLVCLLLFILLFIAISWLPYLRILSHDTSFGDEGVIAQGAYRVFQGEIPFKDFFSGLTPGAFYFYALLFKLFEPTFLVMRLGVMTVSALLIVSVWSVQSRFSVRSYLPFTMVALFLAYFGGPVWFVASHHWLSALLFMVSLYFLMPASPKKIPSCNQAILAGCFSAASAFTLQHRGAAWIVAATFAILLLPSEKRLKTLGAYWGGIILFTLPWALYFIATAGWDTLYYDLVSFTLNQYGKLEGHSGIDVHPIELLQRYIASWQYISRPGAMAQITVWSFGLVGMYCIYLLPFAAIMALLYMQRNGDISRYQAGLLWAGLVASYASTMHRLADTTLFFAAPAAILILSIALSKAVDSNKRHTTNISKSLLIGLCILFFATSLGYSLQMLSRPSSLFQTPAGTVKTIFPEERSTLKAMTSFTSSYIKPEDSVLCYPYNPVHYFIFRYKNPSRYDILTYPMSTLEQMSEAENDLEEKHTRWIVVDSYQKKKLLPEIPFEKYILSHYTVRASSPYATIMERNQ